MKLGKLCGTLYIKIPLLDLGEGFLLPLKWPGTIYCTDFGNAQYIVPYNLDEHLTSKLHGVHGNSPCCHRHRTSCKSRHICARGLYVIPNISSPFSPGD